jgi:hypothetical protein
MCVGSFWLIRLILQGSRCGCWYCGGFITRCLISSTRPIEGAPAEAGPPRPVHPMAAMFKTQAAPGGEGGESAGPPRPTHPLAAMLLGRRRGQPARAVPRAGRARRRRRGPSTPLGGHASGQGWLTVVWPQGRGRSKVPTYVCIVRVHVVTCGLLVGHGRSAAHDSPHSHTRCIIHLQQSLPLCLTRAATEVPAWSAWARAATTDDQSSQVSPHRAAQGLPSLSRRFLFSPRTPSSLQFLSPACFLTHTLGPLSTDPPCPPTTRPHLSPLSQSVQSIELIFRGAVAHAIGRG